MSKARRTVTLKVRMTEEELARLREMAAATGLSASAVVRMLILVEGGVRCLEGDNRS